MKKQVGMLDLRAEYELFADEIHSTVVAVLQSQAFINGPAVSALEQDLCQHTGTAHAIAVSSGTDALLCAMMALGISHGDEVILPAFTFFATAGSVARLGAKPIFVDIDPQTFNLQPESVEVAVTSRTRAIMAVHLFGQCAAMERLREIADRHKLALIEDAAQAIGASRNGRAACALGKVSCVSFYPTKNLGGFGEGGMIFTDDTELADTIRQLRNHGESQRYVHERVGGNFRLDTLKAAILRVKLPHWVEFTKRRQHNAARYEERLASTPVTTPAVDPGNTHVYHQYSILCDQRDALQAFLKDRGISTGIYYPIPLHRQRCFASLGCADVSLPVTDRTCDRILSLPCHPMLTDEDVDYVATCIDEFYQSASGACKPGTTSAAVTPRS